MPISASESLIPPPPSPASRSVPPRPKTPLFAPAAVRSPLPRIATMQAWIQAVIPTTPSLASKVFSDCPLSGNEKFLLLRVGYDEGLAPVGGGRGHRQRRIDTVRNAFYIACRNFWCVRRCIVRWRERRMHECGFGSTMVSGDPLGKLPVSTHVRLVDGRSKHTFYIRDLLRHFDTRLRHSEYFVSEPLAPTNPLTGTVLPMSSISRVILIAHSLGIRVPPLLSSYWSAGLDMGAFIVREFVPLHEIALHNEAYQGGLELADDIMAMYGYAGIPEHCPSVREADKLATVDVLIETHKQPLHSFYIATRSWCEYMSAMGRTNLAEQCMASAEEYSRKTERQRRAAAETEVSEALSTPSPPRPPPRSAPVTYVPPHTPHAVAFDPPFASELVEACIAAANGVVPPPASNADAGPAIMRDYYGQPTSEDLDIEDTLRIFEGSYETDDDLESEGPGTLCVPDLLIPASPILPPPTHPPPSVPPLASPEACADLQRVRSVNHYGITDELSEAVDAWSRTVFTPDGRPLF
jgi:hypothetical protein